MYDLESRWMAQRIERELALSRGRRRLELEAARERGTSGRRLLSAITARRFRRSPHPAHSITLDEPFRSRPLVRDL